MPVSPQFLTLTAGAWTAICDQRDLRNSLLVCALGSDVVLSMTRNTPTAQGPLGPCPAGIYLEGGVGGLAPTIFRLSAEIDNDLVRQEWFAQPALAPVPIVPTDFQILPIVAPSSVQVLTTLAGSLVLVVGFDNGTAPAAQTCTSALSGLIAPLQVDVLADAGGDSQIVTVWAWVSPGGVDNVTVTAGAGVGEVAAAIFYVVTGVTLDKAGANSNPGNPLAASTSSALSAAGEVVLFASNSYGVGAPATAVSSPFPIAYLTGSFNGSPDGTVWMCCTAIATWPIASVATCAVTISAAQTAAVNRIFAFTAPATAPGGAAIVSVFEAFDLPPPIETHGTITVGLPRLSPEGKRHLDNLRRRLAGETEIDNAQSDDAAHDQLDGGPDGD